MIRAVKAFNSLFEKSLDPKSLAKHRMNVERAGRLVVSKRKISIRSFMAGNIRCEAIRAKDNYNPKYAILYAHGGAYNSGGLNYSRVLASKMAIATGMTVFTFDYRLAPENPYPAAFDDGMEVWRFVTKGKYKPDRLFLAGDSAGGNLALCMAQRLRDDDQKMPKGIILFSPWTDMTLTSNSYDEKESVDPVLTKKFVKEAADAYIAGSGNAGETRFSPVYGSFEGFPPTLIMAGENEILLDDSRNLKENIIRDGGRVTMDIAKDGWHVYQLAPLPISRQAMVRVAEFVDEFVI